MEIHWLSHCVATVGNLADKKLPYVLGSLDLFYLNMTRNVKFSDDITSHVTVSKFGAYACALSYKNQHILTSVRQKNIGSVWVLTKVRELDDTSDR